jgi:DNA processing protein
MARGADCIAHHEAVTKKIFTAAVLGFGLSRVYPYERHYMAGEILAKGCLISEFPMKMLGLKQNFPRRNRVISGISDCILVTEAPERSGALITADFCS